MAVHDNARCPARPPKLLASPEEWHRPTNLGRTRTLLTTLRAVLRRSAENFCLRLSYQDRNCNKGTNFSPLVAQLVQVGFDDCIVAGSNATQEF